MKLFYSATFLMLYIFTSTNFSSPQKIYHTPIASYKYRNKSDELIDNDHDPCRDAFNPCQVGFFFNI